MKKHLFLIGDIGTGKSTLIKRALFPYIKDLIGYYVQRVYSVNDLKGFRMCSPASDSYNLDLHSIDSEYNLFIKKISQDNWKINSEIFEKSFFDSLANTEAKSIILLDEIGGFELNIDRVEKYLYKLLDGNIPIIGVIKSQKNKNKMKDLITMDSEFSEEKLKYRKLLNHSEIELIYVDKTNREEVYNKLLNWLGEIYK
jgi:nucleoside-triphosphatase